MDFYKRMELVCQLIPRGRVATYGQIALLCGKPRNSRQVGYGLKMNYAGPAVPAHRILGASGKLTGAGAFKESGRQRALLEQEGVPVHPQEGVDLARYGWKNTLEDALWLEQEFHDRGI